MNRLWLRHAVTPPNGRDPGGVMVNRVLVWAAGSPRLQRQVTEGFLSGAVKG